MNPNTYNQYSIFGQFLIPCMQQQQQQQKQETVFAATQPIMILNYNQALNEKSPQPVISHVIPSVAYSNFNSFNTTSKITNSPTSTTTTTTTACAIEQLQNQYEETQQAKQPHPTTTELLTPTLLEDWLDIISTDENDPSPRSTTATSCNSTKQKCGEDYPLSLHEECDKLYLNYLESCHCPTSNNINIRLFEEDSLHKVSTTNDLESTKNIQTLFNLQLDCEELTSYNLSNNDKASSSTLVVPPSISCSHSDKSYHSELFHNDELQQPSSNHSDNTSFASAVNSNSLFEQPQQNKNTITFHNNSEGHYGTAARNSTNVRSKFKRQRPLSMQNLTSTKKVKSPSQQITWHHVSIDSKMNQQENTFVYENSLNMFETNTFLPTSFGKTITTCSSTNNQPSTNGDEMQYEFASIIIETPESISKKVKRGRPKKYFQLE